MKPHLSKISMMLLAAVILLSCAAAAAATTLYGDNNLLRRSPGDTCSACHRTNYNTPSPGETNYSQTDWNNAIKIHSSETLGTCSNATYVTMTACTANLGIWTPDKSSVYPNGWGVAGGQYGQFTCATCHTSHGTPNIYLIRPTVTAPDNTYGDFPGGSNSPVDFRYLSSYCSLAPYNTYTDSTTCTSNGGTWLSGFCSAPYADSASCTSNGGTWTTPGPQLLGDDSDSHTTSTRICEVCHSQTNYHRYNTTGQSTLAHHPNENCSSTNCHNHRLGFKVDLAAVCGDCHGAPPVNNTESAASNGLVTSDTAKVTNGETGRYTEFGGSAGTGVGAHAAHQTKVPGFACSNCHYGGMDSYTQGSGDPTQNYDGNLAIGFYFFGAAQNGSYQAPAFPVNSNSFTYTLIAGPGSGTTVSTGATRQCSNIACHSSVQNDGGTLPPLSYGSPVWDDPNSVVCGNCHDSDGSQGTATLMSTGSHTKHVGANVSGDYAMACDNCHSGAGEGTSNHVNGNIDVIFGNFAAGGTYSQMPSNPAGNNYGTCTVYCHSDGAATPTYETPAPAWGGAVVCGDCHGATAATPPTTGSHQKHAGTYAFHCYECHSNTVDDVAPATISATGYSTYHVNGTRDVYFSPTGLNPTGNWSSPNCSSLYCHSDGKGGSPNITPDWATPNLPGDCTGCHNNDVAASPNIMSSGKHTNHINNAAVIGTNRTCSDCHSATVASDDRTIIDYSKHVNGPPVDVSIALGGTYTSGTQTCSTVYCHSSGNLNIASPYTTVTWGDAPWATVCNGCHGKTNSLGYPDYTNGGPATTTANSHFKHADPGQHNINCSVCHYATTTDGTSIASGSTTHLNQQPDVSFSGVASGGSWASGTCSSIACHSDGKGNYKNPVWGTDDSVAGCTFCHDFPPATGAHLTHIQDSSLLTQVYGSTEVKSNGVSYAFGCGNCHPTDPAMHGDGTVEISLNPADGGTLKSKNDPSANTSGSGLTTQCNAIYCHSDGTAADIASATTPQWGQTFAGLGVDECAQCHLNSPSPSGADSHAAHVVGIHYDTIYNGSSGLATAGNTGTSSHGDALTSTTINCNICHNSTVTASYNDQNTVCVACHDGTNAPLKGNAAIADKSYHVNGTIDVAFDPIQVLSKAQFRDASQDLSVQSVWQRPAGYKVSGAYDQSVNALNTGTDYNSGTNTCTVACHNDNPVTWGDSNVTCDACHKGL